MKTFVFILFVSCIFMIQAQNPDVWKDDPPSVSERSPNSEEFDTEGFANALGRGFAILAGIIFGSIALCCICCCACCYYYRQKPYKSDDDDIKIHHIQLPESYVIDMNQIVGVQYVDIQPVAAESPKITAG